MLGIFITLFTFILILVSLFMMLVVLMQRANTNAGMGAAFGGGVADSAFGADTTNVLTRATKWAAVAFFLLSAALYLMYIAQNSGTGAEEQGLPEMSSQSAPATDQAPAETAPAEEALSGEAIPAPEAADEAAAGAAGPGE